MSSYISWAGGGGGGWKFGLSVEVLGDGGISKQ